MMQTCQTRILSSVGVPLLRRSLPLSSDFVVDSTKSNGDNRRLLSLYAASNRLFCLCSWRRRIGGVRAMDENNLSAAEDSPEHIVGSWYSVPDLRLRDHRFTVPLDYSTAHQRISVFAREVVAVFIRVYNGVVPTVFEAHQLCAGLVVEFFIMEEIPGKLWTWSQCG